MLFGSAAWIAATFLSSPVPADIIDVLMSAVIMVVAAGLTQRSSPPLPLRDVDGKILPFEKRLGTLSLFRAM